MWQRDNIFHSSGPDCSPRRPTLAILRPMAVVPQMSLENGTWSSRRWLLSMSAGLQLSCHTGEKFWKKNGTGLQRPEKGLLSHGVSRGGAHQCPHAASTGIICTSVSTTLCRFKTNKKIPVIWNIDWTHVMQCIFDCLLMAASKLRFTELPKVTCNQSKFVDLNNFYFRSQPG